MNINPTLRKITHNNLNHNRNDCIRIYCNKTHRLISCEIF